MKRHIEVFFILLILLLMGGASLLPVFQEDESYSYYENRMLKEFPQLSHETLANGQFFLDVESYLADHAAGREPISEASAAANALILRRPVVNDIVIQSDILLPYLKHEAVNPTEISDNAETISDHLAQISAAAESYGGSFYYVTVPGQYSYSEDRYPRYLNNRQEYTDLALETLFTKLEQKGVSYLDLGLVYESLGRPMSLSSAVDSHYSAQGAFVAYEAILGRINEDHPDAFRILTEDDLQFIPLNNYYLGNRARKICDVIKIYEPIYLMRPVVEVPFVRSDNGTQVASTVFNLPADDLTPVNYELYMGGDVAFTQIDTDRAELPSVLIYGDSYTNALEAILYLNCDTMYSIDLRHYTKQTVTEFVKETQPDFVICVRDYGSLLNTAGNGGP